MKAKEYAEEFLNSKMNTTEELGQALTNILDKMLKEGLNLCQARHPNSASVGISALKEQVSKWRAFANIVNKKCGGNVIDMDMFKDLLIKLFPGITRW